MGDFARAVPLLAEGKEPGATLELHSLAGIGIEGGGERFIGEVGFADLHILQEME